MNFERIPSEGAELEEPDAVTKEGLLSAFERYKFERDESVYERHGLSSSSNEADIEIAEIFEAGKVQDAFFEFRNLWDRVPKQEQPVFREAFSAEGRQDILSELNRLD